MANSVIEFEVLDNNRFAMLVRVFNALRTAKQSLAFPHEEYWRGFLDQDALSRFWWPTEQELREWEQRWNSTPVSRRFNDPALRRPWHFGSMLDALKEGEHELLACERVAQIGRLEFRPLAGPFGGTDALKALIEAFGFRVTGEIE